uniref:Uncharacterized protein n=1 Tax=Oryza meridionalis TaxID=40149 RepID=A0A0E0DM98_9ORYZ
MEGNCVLLKRIFYHHLLRLQKAANVLLILVPIRVLTMENNSCDILHIIRIIGRGCGIESKARIIDS